MTTVASCACRRGSPNSPRSDSTLLNPHKQRSLKDITRDQMRFEIKRISPTTVVLSL